VGSLDSILIPSVIAIVLGVGFIFYKRQTTPKTFTEPIQTVVPSYDADISTIQNMIGSVHALTKSHDLGALNGS